VNATSPAPVTAPFTCTRAGSGRAGGAEAVATAETLPTAIVDARG
jgi:hypothetical protein